MGQLTKRHRVTTAKKALGSIAFAPKNVSKMLAVSLDWYAKNRGKLKNVHGIVERIKLCQNQNTRAKAAYVF